MESKIETRKIADNQYGVFCKELIKQGEFFETPCVLLHNKQVFGETEDYLSRFWFMVNESVRALPLHYGVIINHNSLANIDFDFVAPRFMRFTATKDIQPDEELFIDYGENYDYSDFNIDYPIRLVELESK